MNDLKQRVVREIMDNASISRTRAEALASRLIAMIAADAKKKGVAG